MQKFMNDDFLLTTETAKKLFAACRDEPIFDWHCHLPVKEIWENKTPADLTELLLGGDHYKWSLMRNYGVDEKYITGDAAPYDKFLAFAGVLQYAVGNPLYHWTHLELRRYFGIETPLTSASAPEIWQTANAAIAAGGFTPRELIEKSGVKALCTTDDPSDTLEYHKKLAADKSFGVKVVPAFRPDKALNADQKGFLPWIAGMEYISEIKITTWAELKKALADRMDYFAKCGTMATDHALVTVPFLRADDDELECIFTKAKKNRPLTADELDKYRTELLRFLAGEYARRGWVMELHIGAIRNNNSRMFKELGPDSGYDVIDDRSNAANLLKLLDSLDSEDRLPRTVIFNLDPCENAAFEALTRVFQRSGVKGKIQTGSAWWYNDNIDGIKAMLRTKCSMGVLGAFIGMVTDSRSFLSYTRHEYFRRILCALVGEYVESGEYPADMQVLTKLVKDVSYNNAAEYFGI